MSLKVKRNYLEIYSIDDLIDVKIIPKEFKIELVDPPNFQLNKFFYKNIGKKHRWTDRLSWNDDQWINYTINKNLKTYILKNKNDYLCVWGSGYIGLSTACHFAKLGKNVLALDTNKTYVDNLKRGQLKNDDFKPILKIIIFELSFF